MIIGFKQVSSFYKREINTPNKKQTPNDIILDIGISAMVAIFWKSDMEEPDGRQRQALQDGYYAAQRLQGIYHGYQCAAVKDVTICWESV